MVAWWVPCPNEQTSPMAPSQEPLPLSPGAVPKARMSHWETRSRHAKGKGIHKAWLEILGGLSVGRNVH